MWTLGLRNPQTREEEPHVDLSHMRHVNVTKVKYGRAPDPENWFYVLLSFELSTIMYSSQSEADFAGSAMEVDQEDVFTNPSTPTKPGSVPRKAQLAPLDTMINRLKRIIINEDTDAEIKGNLPAVWGIVNVFLTENTPPRLQTHIATITEFQENLRRKGEKVFIDSLRDKSSWQGLPQNCTSFLSFVLEHSDHLLSPEVFLKQNLEGPVQLWDPSPASQEGVQ